MFIFDASDKSEVIVCSCGNRDIALDHGTALALAVDHELRAHPGSYQARRAASHYRYNQTRR